MLLNHSLCGFYDHDLKVINDVRIYILFPMPSEHGKIKVYWAVANIFFKIIRIIMRTWLLN